MIDNDFFRYDFSGYTLRDDQIIDFGIDPEMESLTFTTFVGADWMDAVYSHYFEVTYWKSSRSFQQVVSGPSWFSSYHANREDKYEEYFYTDSGFPAYLVVSWEKYDFKVDGFYNYYYSLLIDATTSGHSSYRQGNYDGVNKPWLEISMQSMVGVGSNENRDLQLSRLVRVLREVADNISITEAGSPSPRLDLVLFEQESANSSPYSFIKSEDRGMGWQHSNWFGDFYKGKPGWVYHRDLGWLRYENYTQTSSWCWHPVLSWFWVSESSFPHVFLESGEWAYLKRDSTLAFDYAGHQWWDLNDLIPSPDDSFSERVSKIQNSFLSSAKKNKAIANYLIKGL